MNRYSHSLRTLFIADCLHFLFRSRHQPNMEAGDVFVILQEMKHATIERKDMDLFVKKKISLAAALCGFQFIFEHLDGRKLLVDCPRGQVIFPG